VILLAHVSMWGFLGTKCKFWIVSLNSLLKISFPDSWSRDAQDLCFLAYIMVAASKVLGIKKVLIYFPSLSCSRVTM
jgi:hypothetical protein